MLLSRWERSVYFLIIGALGGLVAGLVLGFGLLMKKTVDTQPDNDLQSEIEPGAADAEPPLPSDGQFLLVPVSEIVGGHPIHFEVSNQVTLGGGAWVGLIPSSIAHGSETTNDAADIDYVYVEVGGSYTLLAPRALGRYDLRLHNRHPGGAEIDSVTVEVIPKQEPRCCKCRRPLVR